METNILMKKMLIQLQHFNNYLTDTEIYIEMFLHSERQLEALLLLLEYMYAKSEITSLCIDEIRRNVSGEKIKKIVKENDEAIKTFKEKIEKLKHL